jgi:cupin 2 domain-containing protein
LNVSDTGHIFAGISQNLPQEVFEELAGNTSCRIERIISKGHATPPDYWYNQQTHEWVIVLKGRARLRLAADDRIVELGAGDYLLLPAGCRHRVDWTDPDQETVWLAVHFNDAD